MTNKQNKNKEFQLTTNGILDRLIDGRVVDTSEMYERLMLSRQLSVLLSFPTKHFPTRVR